MRKQKKTEDRDERNIKKKKGKEKNIEKDFWEELTGNEKKQGRDIKERRKI